MPADMLPVAVEIFRERNAISQSIRGLRRLVRHGRQKILVVGAAGTGKTTLSTMLGSQVWKRRRKVPGKYISSIGIEFGKIRGLLFSETTILPGQTHHRNMGVWEPHLKRVADDTYNGLIHVVSGGLHAFVGESYRTLYGPRHRTSSKFIAYHRQVCYRRECDILQLLADSICQRKKDFWILTLITKEDLWSPQEQAVRNLYKAHRYNDVIEKLQSHSHVNIVHEIVPVSLEQVNLRDGRNEEIKGAEIVAGYDRVKSLNSIRRFFDTFEQLVGIRERADDESDAGE